MSTAFLVLDVQNGGILRMQEHLPKKLLPHLNDTINAARSANIPIIYVSVCFHPGHPEISSSNKIFHPVKKAGLLVQGTEAAAIHPDIAPLPTDIQIFKRRVSAFTGSDLDVILRGLKAEQLALTGLTTSGAVLATLLEASDLDYKVTVLEDLVADHDQEVHDILVKKVFPKRANVVNADEWVKQLQ